MTLFIATIDIELYSSPDQIRIKKKNKTKTKHSAESTCSRHDARGITEEINRRLRKVLLSLLDVILDPQEQSSLPLVQLAELIILEQFLSKGLLITILNSLGQVHE